MRPLRQVPAGLPHGCGGQQGSPQAEKRNGMHPLLRMYEGVSHKGAALKCETFSAQSAQSSEKVLKCFLGICYNKKSTQAAEKHIERAAAP